MVFSFRLLLLLALFAEYAVVAERVVMVVVVVVVAGMLSRGGEVVFGMMTQEVQQYVASAIVSGEVQKLWRLNSLQPHMSPIPSQRFLHANTVAHAASSSAQEGNSGGEVVERGILRSPEPISLPLPPLWARAKLEAHSNIICIVLTQYVFP